MSVQSAAGPGHVFLVQGRVQDLACDAWGSSCDYRWQWERHWWPDHLKETLSRQAGDGKLKPDTTVLSSRTRRIEGWPDTEPPAILVDMGGWPGKEIEWYKTGAKEFFAAAADLLKHPPRHRRARHLIAIPAFGIGWGGWTDKAGDAMLGILPTLYEAANDTGFDIALCILGDAEFAAAQAARASIASPDSWPLELEEDAARLARHASEGKLALFLGAGTSAGAGLPTWDRLLELLATEHAGIAREDWKALARLGIPPIERGTLLHRHIEDLGSSVKQILEPYRHHSLMHGLLAGLPVREAVTLNYDKLFEIAWTRREKQSASPPPVMPYALGADLDRWLLKMHGCLDHPKDIVLTREHYEGYAEDRGPLTGVLQTLLLTRHLFFVGFGLADDNFRIALAALRNVLSRRATKDGTQKPLGTALMDGPRADTAPSELVWVDTATATNTTAHAVFRQQEIFLDRVASLSRSPSRLRHLVGTRFDAVLSDEDRRLAKALNEVAGTLAGAKGPVAEYVKRLLVELGWENA